MKIHSVITVLKGNDPWGWESEFLERDWTRGIKIGKLSG
jgi:hypothetical protein